MYKMMAFLSTLLCLSSLPVNAKSMTVHIGGVTKQLTTSTSCDRKNWLNSDENACRCCLAKQALGDKRPQDALSHCSKSSKHCSQESLNNIAKAGGLLSDPIDPVKLIKYVQNSANLIPQVALNESSIATKGTPEGQLNEDTVLYFLKTAVDKKLITQHVEALKKGHECISAKKI